MAQCSSQAAPKAAQATQLHIRGHRVFATARNPIIMNNTSGLSVVAYPLLGTYNISKAALAMLSGTLRLELEPFGVQVVDLKAGGVQINFFPNQEGGHYPTLPKGSLYKVAEKEVEHEWSDAGARKDG